MGNKIETKLINTSFQIELQTVSSGLQLLLGQFKGPLARYRRKTKIGKLSLQQRVKHVKLLVAATAQIATANEYIKRNVLVASGALHLNIIGYGDVQRASLRVVVRVARRIV